MKELWRRIRHIDGITIFLIIVVYVIVVSLIGPLINNNASSVNSFLSWQTIILTLRQNSAYGIIACGLTFVILTGNIDLSVGSIYTLCACFCAQSLQSGLAMGIIMPLVIGLLCGAVNGFVVGYLKVNSFITTIATMSIFASLAILYTSSGVISLVSVEESVVSRFTVIGQGYLFGVIPIPVAIFFLVAIVLELVLAYTTIGRRIYYTGANLVSARFAGINTRMTIMGTYCLTGLLTGLASIVTVSRVTSAQAQMGSGIELDIILAIVLGGAAIQGGKGSIVGSVFGIIFIAFLQNGFVFMGMDNVYLQKIISGVILVIALVIDTTRGKERLRWKRKELR